MEEKASGKTNAVKAVKPKVKKTTTSAVKTVAKKKEPTTALSTAKKTAAKAAEVSKTAGKIRIRVSAYEHKVLDQSIKQIMDTAMRYDAEIRGPIPLPTEIKKYTVNRSSFIDKNSREQFEMRIHRRVIDITNPSQKIVEALTNLNLPSGVNVDVKMM